MQKAYFWYAWQNKSCRVRSSGARRCRICVCRWSKVLLDAGAQIDNITVIGGGARSELWGKILASALGRTLTYRKGGEVGPAYGAARLAKLAVSNQSVADVCSAGEITHEISPDEVLVAQYLEKQTVFNNLYKTLSPLF